MQIAEGLAAYDQLEKVLFNQQYALLKHAGNHNRKDGRRVGGTHDSLNAALQED